MSVREERSVDVSHTGMLEICSEGCMKARTSS